MQGEDDGARMQAYLARRLLALIPALFFASLIVFVIVRLVPGNIIDMMLAQNDVGADKLSRDQLISTLGLDRPMWQQYFTWIGGILLHGDFGRSLWQNTPVRELLGARLPVTFQLGLMAMIVALRTAIPIGIYSAIRQDTAGDYLTRSFSILMLAVPSFWMGTMVMVFPSIWWGWSPEVKFVAFTQDPIQNLKQMILPALILGTALSAITMRLTRTMMLEVLRQDYIRTAWAKGLSEQLVVVRHALRNALIPVVTLIGLQAPILIGGAVIVEQIFVIPGMGLLLLDAINQRDYPIITGVSLVIGALRDADQSRRRSELRRARSQGEIPLMTLAIDIPATRPTARAPWRHSLCCSPVPRKAARRGRRRDLRPVPAVRVVRRCAGALRHEPDQPAQPADGAVMGASGSEPTISAATCSRAASMARRFPSSSRFTTATLATVVSIVIGILTGYLGGKFDLIVQRFVDGWMSFPDLIILLVVVSVLGPGLPQIIFTLGLLLGIAGSRIIRSAVVSVRENMYVHAAQSIGASTGRILWRHILPNIMPPIIVLFTTRVGTVILAEFEPLVPRSRRAAADADLGRHAVGIGPHLHVPGTLAGAGAGPLSDRRRLRHQRIRRRACAICSIRACAARDKSQNTRSGGKP